MDTTIIVALIAGAAAILTAIITGIFSVRKEKKEKDNKQPQSIQAGENVIVANGASTQTVNINSPNIQQKNPSQLLIETTHEILDVLGVASKENQKILAPLFLDSPDIRRIQQEFTNLYNIQTQRANFSKWDAVLEHFSTIAENTELSSEIKSLRMRLSEIKEKFYTDNTDFDFPWVNPHSWKYYTKVGLITAFRDKSLSPDQLQYLAKSYISHLRMTIEYIGKSIGKIDVMVDK